MVELLVVTTIIVIMSAVIYPSYRDIRGQLLLERAAHKLGQDIRKAGEMAMSAKMYGEAVPNGYGVYLILGTTFYVLYADMPAGSGNERYDSGEEIPPTPIQMEGGVRISSATPSGMSINFRPPSPTIKIFGNDQAQPVPEAIISLSLTSNPSKTKSIRINAGGLIDIE